MEIAKIRMKIGDHEFEAEGPIESVKEQLAAFKELIGSPASIMQRETVQASYQAQEKQELINKIAHVPIEKVLHVAGRVVSLTALPSSTEDAALLIMLGHKDLRNNDSVTGQEIGDGLAQSGRPVVRTDRVMDKPIENAFVLKSGFKRSTRYRLTNQGHQKALGIARELIATLP